MMQNFRQVNDRIFRGGRPEDARDWIKLGELGIEVIINLESGWFDFFHHEKNHEVYWAVANGITPISVLMSDFKAPSRSSLRITARMLGKMFFNKKVYVHCLHGEDRTGMVIAAYRILCENWSVDAAKKEMYDNGFHRFPYSFLSWEKNLRGL